MTATKTKLDLKIGQKYKVTKPKSDYQWFSDMQQGTLTLNRFHPDPNWKDIWVGFEEDKGYWYKTAWLEPVPAAPVMPCKVVNKFVEVTGSPALFGDHLLDYGSWIPWGTREVPPVGTRLKVFESAPHAKHGAVYKIEYKGASGWIAASLTGPLKDEEYVTTYKVTNKCAKVTGYPAIFSDQQLETYTSWGAYGQPPKGDTVKVLEVNEKSKYGKAYRIDYKGCVGWIGADQTGPLEDMPAVASAAPAAPAAPGTVPYPVTNKCVKVTGAPAMFTDAQLMNYAAWPANAPRYPDKVKVLEVCDKTSLNMASYKIEWPAISGSYCWIGATQTGPLDDDIKSAESLGYRIGDYVMLRKEKITCGCLDKGYGNCTGTTDDLGKHPYWGPHKEARLGKCKIVGFEGKLKQHLEVLAEKDTTYKIWVSPDWVDKVMPSVEPSVEAASSAMPTTSKYVICTGTPALFSEPEFQGKEIDWILPAGKKYSPTGEKLYVLAEVKSTGSTSWYRIRYPYQNQEGWIYSTHVSEIKEEPAAPVTSTVLKPEVGKSYFAVKSKVKCCKPGEYNSYCKKPDCPGGNLSDYAFPATAMVCTEVTSKGWARLSGLVYKPEWLEEAKEAKSQPAASAPVTSTVLKPEVGKSYFAIKSKVKCCVPGVSDCRDYANCPSGNLPDTAFPSTAMACKEVSSSGWAVLTNGLIYKPEWLEEAKSPFTKAETTGFVDYSKVRPKGDPITASAIGGQVTITLPDMSKVKGQVVTFTDDKNNKVSYSFKPMDSEVLTVTSAAIPKFNGEIPKSVAEHALSLSDTTKQILDKDVELAKLAIQEREKIRSEQLAQQAKKEAEAKEAANKKENEVRRKRDYKEQLYRNSLTHKEVLRLEKRGDKQREVARKDSIYAAALARKDKLASEERQHKAALKSAEKTHELALLEKKQAAAQKVLEAKIDKSRTFWMHAFCNSSGSSAVAWLGMYLAMTLVAMSAAGATVACYLGYLSKF